MKQDKLISMANQIADFFKAYPHDDAVAGTLDHIRQFWDRRMRESMLAKFAAGETSGLKPIAAEAIEKLREGSHEKPKNFEGEGDIQQDKELEGSS